MTCSAVHVGPAPNEVEVSLFGPGVGECVVVHLGSGHWMVVDSCIDREAKKPVALRYLEGLGVPVAESVGLVVATHWHDDHSRGLRDVFKQAASAELVCSGALNRSELKEALGASGTIPDGTSGLEELRGLFDELLARKQGRTQSIGPTWAAAERVLLRGPGFAVHALSPSDGTQTLALRELGMGLAPMHGAKRRAVAQRPNALAVVLWLDLGDRRVLLGSDLETGTDPRTGWAAIVGSRRRPPGRADVFKVPHHGSENGHHDGVWTDMLDEHPTALLTPYRAGRRPLPSDADTRRLLASTRKLYATAPSGDSQPRGIDRRVRKMLDRRGIRVRDVEGRMGHVRLRARPGGPWHVELFGAARKVGAPPTAAATAGD